MGTPNACAGDQGFFHCQARRYDELLLQSWDLQTLGALGLVVNAVILWNTIYMDAALAELRAEGFDVRDEDVARLSPLGHGHLNVLGRYAFTLPEFVARGELRPLRRPVELSDNDA